MDSKQITCLALLFLSIVPFSFSASLTVPMTSNLHRLLEAHPENKLAVHENYLRDRLNSDILKVSALSAARSPSSARSDLIPGPWYAEYVAKMAVGTPAKDKEMVITLTGDVSWLQCEKCTNCYNQTNSIFDPSNSTSYSTLKCGDNLCSQLRQSQAFNCSVSDTCLYNQTYGEDWYTSGELSKDTFMIGDTPVENVPFGCGHDNEGEFDDTDGFFTLSKGPLSFVSQTLPQFGGKFSYCLSSLNTDSESNSSSITFGDAAMPTNTSTTPLVSHKKFWNYYCSLKGISVGGIRVTGFNESIFDIGEDGRGGTILDLIVEYSYWPTDVHIAVTKAFREAMNNTHMESSPYPWLDTCYDFSNKTMEELNVPSMELHFEGLDLPWAMENYMTMNDYNGTYCLAFVDMKGNMSFSVIGNIGQQGIRVAYDVPNNLIGLTPAACT